MDHEINNDTRFSVSSSMSSYSASSIVLVLPSAPFCYTLVGQITFSKELRWGQNKLIATECSEWDKRVLTKDTNRNNLRHETLEWKKCPSYLLVTNAGSNLRPSDFKFSHIAMDFSLMSHDIQWIYKGSSCILPRSSMSKVSCLKIHNDKKKISSSFVTEEKIIFNQRPKKETLSVRSG